MSGREVILIRRNGKQARNYVPEPALFFYWPVCGAYFDRIGGAWGWLVYRERGLETGGGK